MTRQVAFCTLLTIDQSLISPYVTNRLSVWGQACKSHLNKILSQKLALCFMCFQKKSDHSTPLFITTKLLPIHSLYYKNFA